MGLTLYMCKNCKEQYVVEYGVIWCPHCLSRSREDQGEFTLEDINELLAERKERYIQRSEDKEN